MTLLREIAAHADELLDTRNTPDYPHALNGIQLGNQGEITGIAAAVDFSSRAIEGAVATHANLLVVHHGMFWGGPAQITGPSLSRLRRLLEYDIAVYSSHIPLDKHQTLGNNILLAKELGLLATGSFARYEGICIGVSGDADLKTMTLAERAERFSKTHGGSTRVSSIAQSRRTRKWGMCTGAGASTETLEEAIECGIDTLIVGEGAHWTAVFAEENDLAIIYAGHYATETLGVTALAQHLGAKFGIPWSFVSAPTGL